MGSRILPYIILGSISLIIPSLHLKTLHTQHPKNIPLVLLVPMGHHPSEARILLLKFQVA